MVTATGWKNKNGTSNRSCNCGSWKQHWINSSGENWPTDCSIDGCRNTATLGAHIINIAVQGEKIVPACYTCNQKTAEITLKNGITLVSANKSQTCEK